MLCFPPYDNRESRTSNMHSRPEESRIGDLLLKQNDALDQYQTFLTRLPEILAELDAAFRKNKAFELFYRNFEQARFCYLPIAAFLLKPAQRLFQYQNCLEREWCFGERCENLERITLRKAFIFGAPHREVDWMIDWLLDFSVDWLIDCLV